MTVQQLIDELNKIEDKSVNVGVTTDHKEIFQVFFCLAHKEVVIITCKDK